MVVLITALVVPAIGLAAAAPPPLGTAADYAVIANTTITNTGPTLIDGNIALSGPGAPTGLLPGVVTGTKDLGNAAAAAAQADVLTAFHAALAGTPVTQMSGVDLGGKTLAPGIYHFGSSAALTGTLTLDGHGAVNPTFIFQIGSTLTTGTGSRVVLTRGAAACSVFWAITSSATIGTFTSFQGNLIAQTSITMVAGATIGVGGGRNGGRAFAHTGAVTLDTNTIIPPSGNCPAPAPARTPAPTPAPTPVPPVATSAPTPVPTPVPLPATPRPTPTPAASHPGASPSATSGPASSGTAAGPLPVGSQPPPGQLPPNLFVIPTDLEGRVSLGGAIGFIGPFVVPAFLAAASGFLIILLMLAQALGGLAWLPVVRRRVGSFGIGRPH
jgi:hypothetical protein